MNTPDYLDDEKRYTPQQVADLWQCSVPTVQSLLRSGKLGGFKLGRDWRITPEALREYEQNPENQQKKLYRNSKDHAKKPILRIV